MKTTWIALVSRVKATVLEQHDLSPDLTIVTQLVNPAGALKDGEPLSDRYGHETYPSRAVSKGSFCGAPAGGRGLSPKEDILRRLCTTVADFLKQGLQHKAYDELVLVAEPHTLGVMKHRLGKGVLRHLSSCVRKNLCEVPTRELPAYLTDTLHCLPRAQIPYRKRHDVASEEPGR